MSSESLQKAYFPKCWTFVFYILKWVIFGIIPHIILVTLCRRGFSTIASLLVTGKHRFSSLRCISLWWRRASLAQCTIVCKCCADPQYVLFDICGIPAKFYPDYPYRWETDWWEEDKAQGWYSIKTNVPRNLDIPVEPIRRSEILSDKYIWRTKWQHIVLGLNSFLL